jgi:hypothetical protein
MDLAINSLIFAIIGGAVVAFVNFLLRKRERQYFEEVKYRRKSYTDLLINIRGFLENPKPGEKEKSEMKQKFLDKYYNEIWLYASPTVIKGMNRFLRSISDKKPNIDKNSIALGRIILNIRKSWGIKNTDFIFFNRLKTGDYEIYSSK